MKEYKRLFPDLSGREIEEYKKLSLSEFQEKIKELLKLANCNYKDIGRDVGILIDKAREDIATHGLADLLIDINNGDKPDRNKPSKNGDYVDRKRNQIYMMHTYIISRDFYIPSPADK